MCFLFVYKIVDTTERQPNKGLAENSNDVCNQSNLVEYLVLVHGKLIIKPIDKLSDANFSDDVHHELETMRLTQIYRTQAYSWPHLMRRNSLIIVNSARTGKTMSYLPAISSLIKMNTDENLVPDGVGPIGIIIASSSIEVEKIARICRTFYNNNLNKIKPIVESYGVRTTEKAIMHLLNGCEILVTTPPSLVRLYNSNLKLFDKKRVQHLFIDNIDLWHDKLRTDLHLILRKCGLNETRTTTSLQLVVTARNWNPSLTKFLKICNNPLLCIGAYIEAAVYAKTKFLIKIKDKKSKSLHILDFVNGNNSYLNERLVIVCNKDDEVDEVIEILKSSSCLYIALSSKSTAVEIELSREWHNRPMSKMCILVCTDSVLRELKIRNAQNLIHYSLPMSWTRFTFRFSVFFDYYEDLVKNEVKTKSEAISIILLDESNNSQLPRLVEFLQLHGQVSCISKEIFNLASRIKMQREESVAGRKEFCSNIMEFGQCMDQNDCNCRHLLTKYDTPTGKVLSEGTIKIKILNVVSPTHYRVRLLEHKSLAENSTWCKIQNSRDYLKFSFKFSQYFSNCDNDQICWPINVNDICVVLEMKTFYRCQILHVSNSPKGELNTYVSLRVKLVDVGRVIPCRTSNILVLPDQFKDFPFQAIDLRLTGLMPHDFELYWDSRSTSTVQNWIDKYVTDDVHVEANIKFALLDTIWVDNINLMEKLKSISSSVRIINIKRELLEKRFAITSDEATKLLLAQALDCGIINNSDFKNITTSSSAIEKNYVKLNHDSFDNNTSITLTNENNSGSTIFNSCMSHDSKLNDVGKENVSSALNTSIPYKSDHNGKRCLRKSRSTAEIKEITKAVERSSLGIGHYDPDTKHFLDVLTPGVAHASKYALEDNWDHCNYQTLINDGNHSDSTIYDVDVQFTKEEILQLMNLPSTAKILPPTPKILPIVQEEEVAQKFPEINDEPKDSKKQNKERETSTLKSSSEKSVIVHKSESLQPENVSRLIDEHKCPQVSWQQSDSLICLKISAPDIDDYYLKVTTTYMVFSAVIEGKLNVTILNFFGGIDSSLTSHEIRGLKVVMRLVKSLKGVTWPRLISESDKIPWLKYNYDAIIIEDEVLPNANGIRRLIQPTNYLNSSDDDDDDDDTDYLIHDEIVSDAFDLVSNDF